MTTTLRLPRTTTRVAGWVVAAVALSTGVAACSSSGSTSTTTAAAAAAPTGQLAASDTAGGQAGGLQGGGRQRFDPAQLQKIRECLSAAGITLPSVRAFPSGRPSGFPSDGTRPSNFPSGRPSGGFGGGFGGVLNSPEAKAALEACGITVPTFSPRVRASGAAVSPTAG